MIDKKAIIITFHCCPNYGAVLQTYGLYQYLKTQFNDVEVLDYRPRSLMDEYRNINTYSFGSIAMSVWSLFPFLRRKKRFSKFINQMHLSDNQYCTGEQIKKTDAQYCFVGSDQIWNPDITKGFDGVYFGVIPHGNNFVVISYAASFGKNKFTSDDLLSLNSLLSNVDNVSVREDEAKEILEQKLDLNADVVLDPTLLAGVDVYRKLVRTVSTDDYLFIYTLNQSPDSVIRPLACKIAQKKDLKIIEVNGNRKNIKKAEHKVIYDAGPVEFLSLLANAKYVVTDSFHGTAFSLLFHRNFITIPHKTRGGRMLSLLSIVGLTKHLYANDNSVNIDDDVNWDDVDNRLALARKKSEDFIHNAIRNNHENKA